METNENYEKSIKNTLTAMEIMGQEHNTTMGITQEYNAENRSKLWDSVKGKKEYKEKVFGNNETYRDVDGNLLHKSTTAAQRKYHMKNEKGENISTKWAEHAVETDHVNSLKSIHDNAKHNAFLTDADMKEIGNSEVNYRVLSKHQNTSKGEKSDWEVILDKDSEMSTKAKKQMAKEKLKSDVALHGKFAARTAENIGSEFVVGATDALAASVIPLTVEAVDKLCKVASGEKTLKEAAKDMGHAVVDVSVIGGTNQLLGDVLVHMQHSKNPYISQVANSSEIAKIVTVALVVKDSAAKYLNGEIDGKEFIEEVGEKGTMMVAGMIGGTVGREIGTWIGGVIGTGLLPGIGTAGGAAVGRVVGEILGTIISSVACAAITTLFDAKKHMNDFKLKENQIKKIEREALSEMEKQRMKFRSIIERELKQWDEEIQTGFNMILAGACKETYDLQGVTDGLDKILSVFGKKVAFHNLEEYEAQLDMPLKLSF